MKNSKINNDIYNLSKTLYGGERFELILEAMRINDANGTGNDNLPKICTVFETTKESDQYRRTILDFYVLNFVVFPMLQSQFSICLAGILHLLTDENMTMEVKMDLAQKIMVRIVDFFKMGMALETINKKNDFDMLTFQNREKLQSDKEIMKEWYKICSFKLHLDSPPIVGHYDEEEIAEEKDLIENIFLTFYSLSHLE